MKLRITLLIMIFASVLSLACTQGTSNDPINVNYKTGTAGIDIQLVPNHPPSRLIEGGAFTIAAQVSNKGAYDTFGTIAVIGLDQIYTPVQEQEADMPALKGRSESNTLGDFYVQEFFGGQTALPPGSKEYKTKFLVLANYEYLTVLNSNVCINPALLEIEREQGSCTVQDKQRFSGQGAPVAFTQVEEVISPANNDVHIQFTFTVENRGNGEVVSPIRIDDVRLGTKPLTCNKREVTEFELKQRRNTVVCSRIESRQSAYTSALSATLQYTYKTTKLGEFVIQRAR